MRAQLITITTAITISLSAQAELFNYTQDQYVKIRGIERCVNKAGWDNDQEVNDQIISLLLQSDGLPYDFEKLQRDEYWYQNKVQSSKKVEMEYNIAAIEQDCSTQHDINELASRVQLEENTITVSIDEMLDL